MDNVFQYVNLEGINMLNWPTLIFYLESDFVNATALCKFYGRNLANWTCSKASANLILSWQNLFPNKPYCLVFSNNKLVQRNCDGFTNCLISSETQNHRNGCNIFDGTYLHAHFIPFLFEWLDATAVIPACETLFKYFKYHSCKMQENVAAATTADAITEIFPSPQPSQWFYSPQTIDFIQETEAQVIPSNIPVTDSDELKNSATVDQKKNKIIKSRKQPCIVFKLDAPGEYQLAFSKKAGDKIKQSCPNAIVLDQFEYDPSVIKSDVVCSKLKTCCKNMIGMKRRRFKLLADNGNNTDECVKEIKKLCV